MRTETAVFTMLRALMPVDNQLRNVMRETRDTSLAFAGHAIKTT